MDIIKDDLLNIKRRLEGVIVDPLFDSLLKDFISSGSKFVRSTLTILYLKSQNIEISENVLKILTAGEIVHNASLLHDDVLDDAQTRRGNITLAKKYDAKLAILSGDYLLSLALDLLMEINNPEVTNIFKDCIKNMTGAEIRQYFLRDKDTQEEEYLEIIKGKTGTLFSAIMESCAIITESSRLSAKEFGLIFGTCFQINNDLKNDSAYIDKKNGIQTARDILGIEKTTALLDNYKEEMMGIIKSFPENTYKKELEGLIKSL